jgi:MoaA/NifB/PqqE/SkfB family radical SAM enzyme
MSGRHLVVAEMPEGFLVVNRQTNQAALFRAQDACELWRAILAAPSILPAWLQSILAAVGADPLQHRTLSDIILRDATRYSFRKVTWELTERCNLQCIHCYLDNKSQRGLPRVDRKALLDKLEQAGCLWLHLSGGEALADPMFGETYSYAWNRGLMVNVSTNGRLIRRWVGMFKSMPPFRVNVSLYGASAKTYGVMTGVERAYKEVMNGIEDLRLAGIRLRVSIIVTKANVHEVAIMESRMKERGIEHHTFWKMSPTLLGGEAPLELEADIKRSSVYFGEQQRCSGGESALHIFATGRASPCRLLPNISVDMLSEEISELTRLKYHPGTRPVKPECKACPSNDRCTVCAPVYALHKKAGNSVKRVCRG